MSYDYNPSAYGAGSPPAYDPQAVDLRSLDEIQGAPAPGAAPAYSLQPAAPSGYQMDGVDLRSIDEIQGGPQATGRIPGAPVHERERGVGDFAVGVGRGFVGGVRDTVKGVAALGRGAWNIVSHPSQTRARVADWGTYAAQHPGQTLGRVVSFPFRLAGAMVQPYSDAIRRGQPGQVVGRLGFDVALTALTLKAGDALRNGTQGTHAPGAGDIDGGVLNNGGGGAGGRASGAGRGGGVVTSTRIEGGVHIGDIKNTGSGTVNINIGGIQGSTVSGGGGGITRAVDVADDVAGTMAQTGRRAAGRAAGVASVADDVVSAGDNLVSHLDDTAIAGSQAGSQATRGGWFRNLRSQPWEGTRNINPGGTFQSMVGGLDNTAARMTAVSSTVGQAFNRTLSFMDRGLSLLHPDNAIQALQRAGEAVVRVPRFIIQNPGTSLKYAVAGTATGVYTAGQMAVAGARFVVTNPGHAVVLTAAAGRTLGSLPVRTEQRSSATYDPDNRNR